ncbi:hypothetical protein ACIRCZ_08070 [Leifsonia sp. NPDC102414]|uniref:hypothetical protein n=1 Tax=Leifsonia sp. NPDC102414 TaxID=3364124 RepID=UPI0038037422
MRDAAARRPVYVLGAGFSKAIHRAMPITNELGEALASRLGSQVSFDLRVGQSFEDWLTLQMTPLPFLESYENATRAAHGAHIVAEIAHVLDETMAVASTSECPLWLRQLVALWHQERAVILTFNYDTLIERAVNGNPPTTTSTDGQVHYVMGDHVVFPAPPAPQAQFLGDMGAGHTDQSFEILKLHGSLAWYWAAGDSSGSTLIRIREKQVFGSLVPMTPDSDFDGATKLDRYLVPPITSKDGFYSSYLSHTLWRQARSLVAAASEITLMGYSLPAEDRVASQLVNQAPKDAKVSVVDRDPGSAVPPTGILGNLIQLGIEAESAWSGDNCLSEYVGGRVEKAAASLSVHSAFGALENRWADVVVAVPSSQGIAGSGRLCVIAWNRQESVFETHSVDSTYIRGAVMPLREIVFNATPSAYRELDDFVTAEKLKQLVEGGREFIFRLSATGEKAVGVGVERINVGTWEALQVHWAPL